MVKNIIMWVLAAFMGLSCIGFFPSEENKKPRHILNLIRNQGELMGIYEKINEIRKRKGVTWKYLNEQIPGAYASRMTELKNRKTSLSNQQLEIVAEVLGTSTDYLLGNTDNPAPAGQKEKPPADGGEPVDPVMQEIMGLVEAATDVEREMMLAVVKAIKERSSSK